MGQTTLRPPKPDSMLTAAVQEAVAALNKAINEAATARLKVSIMTYEGVMGSDFIRPRAVVAITKEPCMTTPYTPGPRQATAERPEVTPAHKRPLELNEAAFLNNGKTPNPVTPSVRAMPIFGGVATYEALERVLTLAYNQSAKGKGHARHARDKPFSAQPIITIPELLTGNVGLGGLAYQTIKKTQEACGMAERHAYSRAMHELLGVIVYAAAAYLHVERMAGEDEEEADFDRID